MPNDTTTYTTLNVTADQIDDAVQNCIKFSVQTITSDNRSQLYTNLSIAAASSDKTHISLFQNDKQLCIDVISTFDSTATYASNDLFTYAAISALIDSKLPPDVTGVSF